MTAIEVIVPFWGEDPVRLRSLAWVERGLASAGLKVTIARPLPTAEITKWEAISKGAVLWPAIQQSEAEIVILHDADVWCGLDVWSRALWDAVVAVADGMPWAKPHHQVFRLSEAASDGFLAGKGTPQKDQLVEEPYEGVTGGGVIVGRREIFLDVPVDPRFTSWGQEDQAFGEALWTLYGGPWIGEAPLLHLWHQPRRRLSRGWGSREGKALYRRYHRAFSDPSEMRKLVSEAHSALESFEPASNSR